VLQSLIGLISPSNESCEICLRRRSVQSQARSGFPTRRISVAKRRCFPAFGMQLRRAGPGTRRMSPDGSDRSRCAFEFFPDHEEHPCSALSFPSKAKVGSKGLRVTVPGISCISDEANLPNHICPLVLRSDTRQNIPLESHPCLYECALAFEALFRPWGRRDNRVPLTVQ
jgi:hypothetical protein